MNLLNTLVETGIEYFQNRREITGKPFNSLSR